jgi:hypothetical protein
VKTYKPETSEFADEIEIPEKTDRAHADIINAAPKQLLQNTIALKEQLGDIDLDTLNQQMTEQIQEALKITGAVDEGLANTKVDVLELTMAVQTLMDADVISSDNVAIELFDTTDDVSVQTGYYDSENKRLWA